MARGTREHDLFLEIKERLTEDVRLAYWSREFIIKSDFIDATMGGAAGRQDKADRVRFAEMRGRRTGCVGARWRTCGDPACVDFVEGQDGRLYHKELINGEMVNQLYVPMEMRERLVVTKHGSAAGATEHQLRRWPS